MDEKTLISLMKKDDHSAIRIIFDHCHSSLCLLAYRIVKDSDQAKDIVQDVFIKLWHNRQNLEIASSLNAYLRRAVVNTALNYLESSSRWKKLELKETELSPFAANTTEQHFSYAELDQKVNNAIQELPVRTRTVFKLIRSEEMSYKEVAESLNISMKAVEKEMMKALKLLRGALKDYLNSSLIVLLLHSL